MSDNAAGKPVAVDHLRPGMYVLAPDRPWVELPFLFQGFVIESDEEIRVFREYCRRVFIDPERTRSPDADSPAAASVDGERERPPAAAGATHRPAERAAGRRADRRPVKAREVLDDQEQRFPDAEGFRREVEVAGRARVTARRFLDEAFADANKGVSINLSGANSTVAELMTRVAEKPTASLWLTSLNDRDDFTASHSINTCVLVLLFCLRAKVDPDKLEAIGMGSLLHDVGKSILPREMLNRPGPLNDDEWQEMKRHPDVGYRILGDSGRMSRGSLNIVRMHHERLDGHGYPNGLGRRELPNYVLLPALANRYQAMVSPRPYRQAMAPDRVLQQFYNDADSWYGENAVRAFMRAIGIYPVGSVVELDNGALAVIVSSRPNTRLRPTVQLVLTPDSEPYEKVVLLNLAAEDERHERKAQRSPARMIRRVRTAADTGIDPAAIIADSFGIQVA